MTDNEIIKALEERDLELIKNTLSHITHQKAKIEELSEILSDRVRMNRKEIRSEAIKEFAERLGDMRFYSSDINEMVVMCDDVDNLAKMMIAEQETV